MSEVDPYQQAAASIDEVSQGARYLRVGVLAGVMIAGMAPELISKVGERAGVIERDILPEPWDIPDHIGNANEAGLYTVFAFSVLNAISTRRKGEEYGPQDIQRTAIGAFVVSSAIQILGEKYGQGIGLPNQGDMIDAAYGVVFSAFAALACSKGYTAVFRKQQESVDRIIEKYQSDTAKEARTTSNLRQSEVVTGENPQKSAGKATKQNSKAAQQKRQKARSQQKKSRKANRPRKK